MKGKFCGILFVLFFGFLLSSCITTTVFDNDVPKENTTKLLIMACWSVKTYNGIDVNLKGKLTINNFIIPAGETELIMDLDYYEKTGYITFHYAAKDVVLTYNFEAGHEYYIYFDWADDDGRLSGKNRTESLLIFDKKDGFSQPALYARKMIFE